MAVLRASSATAVVALLWLGACGLLPASVGANWFRDWVMCEADEVLFLNGRLAFMPERPTWLYPKDCMLVLYRDCPRRSLTGFDVWDWRRQR